MDEYYMVGKIDELSKFLSSPNHSYEYNIDLEYLQYNILYSYGGRWYACDSGSDI